VAEEAGVAAVAEAVAGAAEEAEAAAEAEAVAGAPVQMG
jgi:hypothetical protein